MSKNAMSLSEALDLPVAVDLVTAGRAHGLGRTKSHELARRGEFPCPVLRIGNAYRVTRADLLRSLGVAPEIQNGPSIPRAHPDAIAWESADYADGGGEAVRPMSTKASRSTGRARLAGSDGGEAA